MQIVNVRFHVKPELADAFPAAIADLVDATRAEPGNLWYLWSRSLDDPSEFVVLEGYTDDGFAAHAQSAHFQSPTRNTSQIAAIAASMTASASPRRAQIRAAALSGIRS